MALVWINFPSSNYMSSIFNFFHFFFLQMEQKTGLLGLDQFTISLICGVSVLSLVLVIISLGIIGFFIKVGVQPFFCLSSTDQLSQSIHQTFLSSQFGWVISSGLTTVWEGYILGFGKKPVHNPRSPIQVKVQNWDITHTFPPFTLW